MTDDALEETQGPGPAVPVALVGDLAPQPGPGAQPIAGPPTPTPATGRAVFRNLRRQLADEELATPGVHKLLLAELDRADEECAELRGYESRYHERDKEAAILTEKLRGDRAIDVCFGVGVGLGGIIAGLAPYMWDKLKPDAVLGTICLGIGLALIAGAAVVRAIKR